MPDSVIWSVVLRLKSKTDEDRNIENETCEKSILRGGNDGEYEGIPFVYFHFQNFCLSIFSLLTTSILIKASQICYQCFTDTEVE